MTSGQEGPRVNQLDRVKQEYTQAAREILQRSMRSVAKTKLTPDMLTLLGVTLCIAGAVLVGFEDRNEKLFFWLAASSSSQARSRTSSTGRSRGPRARAPSSERS